MPPKKILAMKLRSLGDTVLMTAPLRELRKAYPEAEIQLALSAAWAPLFENDPDISKVWTYERHSEATARAKAAARLAYVLRKEHFDCVVNFHASPTSAMIAFATGSRKRAIHFHGHKDKNKYSTVEIPGKGILKPVIERDMDSIRAFGLHVPSGRLPQVHLQENEKRQASEWLQRLGLAGPVLGIGLGASRYTKCWPIDRFAALAVSWARSTQGSAIGIAGGKEQPILHQFLKAVDDELTAAISDPVERSTIRSRIAGECSLPIRQLTGILSQISVFAGNDSGPKHLAVAVGTPTVTVFGPEHPFEWHPYPVDRHPYLFVENLPCRKDALPGMPAWCGLHDCSEEQHKCMKMIGVDPVMTECRRLMR